MRVLAINDVSCVGKCSLSVTLPIISACGITCDVLPTALLSTHTGGFENYTFLDLTQEMERILLRWEKLGLQFDIIYSGYLGNIAQINVVEKIVAKFLTPNGLFIVDPVMGDGGTLYAGFTSDYVQKMRNLCKRAHFILPNLTEACYLAGVSYGADITVMLKNLKSVCSRPIVTGIVENDCISVFYIDKNGNTQKYSSQNVAGFFHGAGDVFASALVGAIAYGKEEETAIRLAADFTSASIRRSAKEVADKRYGLNFEAEIFSFLKNLNNPLFR